MTTPSTPGPLATDPQIVAATGGVALSDDLRARIAAAEASIRRAAGWHIGPVITETVLVDADGGDVLPLPTGRLVGVTAVTATEAGTDLTPQVRKSVGGWIKLTGGRFPDGPESVSVTMTHGYVSGTYPDLVALLVDVARRTTIDPSIAQESNGARSTTYREPGLFAHERGQLAAFAVGRTP